MPNARARWIRTAKETGATHIISVCDTFDYEDYPVYVHHPDDLEDKKHKVRCSSMQKINEVIVVE